MPININLSNRSEVLPSQWLSINNNCTDFVAASGAVVVVHSRTGEQLSLPARRLLAVHTEQAAVHTLMERAVVHMPMEQVADHMREPVVDHMPTVQVVVHKGVVAPVADIG
jgi:hypothetical protein